MIRATLSNSVPGTHTRVSFILLITHLFLIRARAKGEDQLLLPMNMQAVYRNYLGHVIVWSLCCLCMESLIVQPPTLSLLAYITYLWLLKAKDLRTQKVTRNACVFGDR